MKKQYNSEDSYFKLAELVSGEMAELSGAMCKDSPLDESETLAVKTALIFAIEIMRNLTGKSEESILESFMAGYGNLCASIVFQNAATAKNIPDTPSPDSILEEVAKRTIKAIKDSPNGFASY